MSGGGGAWNAVFRKAGVSGLGSELMGGETTLDWPRTPLDGELFGLPIPGKFHPVARPKLEARMPGIGGVVKGTCRIGGDSASPPTSNIARCLRTGLYRLKAKL